MQNQLKIEQEIQSISKSKGKVAAVAYCMQALNMGLKEAKDYVETLLEHTPVAFSENIIELDVKIRQLLAEDRKLEAIKLHKETTQSDLAFSLDYVNKIIDPNYLENKKIKKQQSFTSSFFKAILSFILFDWIKPVFRFFSRDKA
jgi:ribosomal protein L7/L12